MGYAIDKLEQIQAVCNSCEGAEFEREIRAIMEE